MVAASTAGMIACYGGTTTVTVSATGGTAPYTGTGTFTVSAGTYRIKCTYGNALCQIKVRERCRDLNDSVDEKWLKWKQRRVKI